MVLLRTYGVVGILLAISGEERVQAHDAEDSVDSTPV